MRIACLLVPDFPLASELRAHPALIGQPLVISEAPGPNAKVISISPEAHKVGIRLFNTVEQARIAYAAIRVCSFSSSLEHATRNALLKEIVSISPRYELEKSQPGSYATEAVIYIDTSDCSTLFQSDKEILNVIIKRVARLGITSVAAVADSRDVARIAAYNLIRNKLGDTAVVPSGESANFLSPLSLTLLDLDHELYDRLSRFGIQKIGELARMSYHIAITRLGIRSIPILRIARGEIQSVPLLTQKDREFEEHIDLDSPISSFCALSLVLRNLITCLCEKISSHQLGCSNIDITLVLDKGRCDIHRVVVNYASLDVGLLLRLTLAGLKDRKVMFPINRIELRSAGLPLPNDQLNLFRMTRPIPSDISTLVSDLEEVVGPNRVGSPALGNSHRPDSYSIQPFGSTSGDSNLQYIQSPSVRAVRPALHVQVTIENGLPEEIHSTLVTGRIIKCIGPWRSSGSWWSTNKYFVFEHYDIVTNDGLVLRLRLDQLKKRWEVDGIYD